MNTKQIMHPKKSDGIFFSIVYVIATCFAIYNQNHFWIGFGSALSIIYITDVIQYWNKKINTFRVKYDKDTVIKITTWHSDISIEEEHNNNLY